jgi:hypothetical protein
VGGVGETVEVEKTAEDVSSALDTLGGELKKGYERLKNAL